MFSWANDKLSRLSETLAPPPDTPAPRFLAALASGDENAALGVLRENQYDFRHSPIKPRGVCALHVAASYGCLDVLRELLNAGVRVDYADHDGRTALHHAASSSTMSPPTALAAVRMLVEECGADASGRDVGGMTPYDVGSNQAVRGYLLPRQLQEETRREQLSKANVAAPPPPPTMMTGNNNGGQQQHQQQQGGTTGVSALDALMAPPNSAPSAALDAMMAPPNSAYPPSMMGNKMPHQPHGGGSGGNNGPPPPSSVPVVGNTFNSNVMPSPPASASNVTTDVNSGNVCPPTMAMAAVNLNSNVADDGMATIPLSPPAPTNLNSNDNVQPATTTMNPPFASGENNILQPTTAFASPPPPAMATNANDNAQQAATTMMPPPPAPFAPSPNKLGIASPPMTTMTPPASGGQQQQQQRPYAPSPGRLGSLPPPPRMTALQQTSTPSKTPSKTHMTSPPPSNGNNVEPPLPQNGNPAGPATSSQQQHPPPPRATAPTSGQRQYALRGGRSNNASVLSTSRYKPDGFHSSSNDKELQAKYGHVAHSLHSSGNAPSALPPPPTSGGGVSSVVVGMAGGNGMPPPPDSGNSNNGKGNPFSAMGGYAAAPTGRYPGYAPANAFSAPTSGGSGMPLAAPAYATFDPSMNSNAASSNPGTYHQ